MESARTAFHAQLAAVMDSLLAAAVCEIAKIFESSLCEHQEELLRKAGEISKLRCRLENRQRAKTGGTEESSRDTEDPGSVLIVGKEPSQSQPEEVLCMLKEEATAKEGAVIKLEHVRERSDTIQVTDGNVCISQTGRCSTKSESSLLQAGEWLPGETARGGVSGLENLRADGADYSSPSHSSICNDPPCVQRSLKSDEISIEGDGASFAYLGSENQNLEEGPGEKEAQTDPPQADPGEIVWRPRDDRGARGHVNLTRRISNSATRDPLRRQSNSQLPAAQQANAHSHPTTPNGGSGRPYSCPYCTKCFTYPSHQRRHLLRHTGVRLHPCQFCNKSFLTPSELTVHMRTHTGERPFGCAQCGKRFARSGNMKAHQRDVHMGKRPFACVECGKRFAHRGNLRVHNHRVHHGDPCYTEGQPEPDMSQDAI